MMGSHGNVWTKQKNTGDKFHFSFHHLWNVFAFWTHICPAFANSVDPDHLASKEAKWSGSALFDVKYLNVYQQSGYKLQKFRG